MSIKHDPIDKYRFKKLYDNEAENKYNDFDKMNNLYQSFYQKNVEFSSDTNEIEKTVLEEIQNTPEWSNIRVISKQSSQISYSGTKELFPKFQEILKTYQDKARGLKDKALEDFLRKHHDGIRYNLRNELKQTEENLNKEQEMMEVLARGTGDGTSVKYDTNKALELSKKFKNNPTFQEIIKLAGRMQSSARKIIQSKTVQASNTVVGIEYGNDLERIVPEEFAMLLNKDTEYLFMKRYIDNALQIYKTKDKENMEYGPIILVSDYSGSMRGIPENFVRGFMFGLLEIAKQQNRPVYVILFNNRVIFEREILTTNDILEVIEIGSSGGTDFNSPLKKVTEYIENNSKFSKADMIFISDGDGYLYPENLENFNKAKERISFKSIGVSIGFHSFAMEKFCDKIIPISRCIFSDEGVQNLMKEGFNL